MILKPCLFFCLSLALACGAAAQQPVSTPSSSATGQQQAAQDNSEKLPTVRVRTDEVNVVFTVVDKDGRFVRDLKQEQFRILDNNRPPRQIMNFSAQTNLPLHVGLLIDASNSIRDRFQFEKDAASEFLYEVIRPKSDRAFVLAFDETWDVTQDFTGDVDKLRTGVKAIVAGGGTALWDAVYFSCRDKLMKEPASSAVRRAIILVSDGEDNQSRVFRQEAVDMAQRAEVIVYAISTTLMSSHSKGDENLRALAEASRRVEEARRVIATMAENGLTRGEHGLEIYVMCEIPNNVIQIDAFSKFFDGFQCDGGSMVRSHIPASVRPRSCPLYPERIPGSPRCLPQALGYTGRPPPRRDTD
jgi:VWFA-related protein